MDPITIVGNLVVFIFQFLQRVSHTVKFLMKKLAKDDDTFLSAAKCFCPQLIPQMKEAEELIKPDTDYELLAFRDSYLCDSNVTGIKGAIIAQVAMTGLTLPHLHDTHWLPSALFVVSAVGATLAVYISTVSRKVLGALKAPVDIRSWLSMPPSGRQFPANPQASDGTKNGTPPPLHERRRRNSNTRPAPPPLITQDSERHQPSLHAALVLAMPSMLLQISLSCILLALGSYFGSIWLRCLTVNALKVFISCIFGIFGFIGFYYIPKTLKDIELEQMDRFRSPSAPDSETAVASDDELHTPRTPRTTPDRHDVPSSARRRERASGSWRKPSISREQRRA